MIEPGDYQLNKGMTMVDVEKGSMYRLPNGDSIQVLESTGAGKCRVKSSQGEFIAMEMTLKTLYLDGWLTLTSKKKFR